MAHSKDNENSQSTIDGSDIIRLTIRGRQTRGTVTHISRRLQHEIEKLQSQGKKVKVLTDISGISPRDSTNESKQIARNLISEMSIDKTGRFAIYGKGSWMNTIMYLTRMPGKVRPIRFFTTRKKAYKWLNQDRDTKKELGLRAGFYIGIILIVIGLMAIIGWQVDNAYLKAWIPTLRPMNPLSAVGLIVMGAGFMAYWKKKLQYLRIAGVAGIALGAAALFNIGIDSLLFHDKVVASGVQAQIADSSAICFIIMGIGALIAGRKWHFFWVVECTLMMIVGFISLLNIFGEQYASEWIRSFDANFVMPYNLAYAFAFSAVAFAFLMVYRRWKIIVVEQISRIGWLIVIVLALVQVVTYSAFAQAVASNKKDAQAAFTAQSKVVEDTLKDRFTAYTNALYGFQGLFTASMDINYGEFTSYYKTTGIAAKYPGFRTLSFISKVNDKQIPAFIQKQRNDKSLSPAGNPSFSVNQQSSLPEHYIITFTTTNTTLGTDLGSNPDRLKAFQRAEQTGQPVASGTIEFAATATSLAQEGFFITVPVAYEDNPSKVIGFVNTVFNYDNFFKDTFNKSISTNNLNIETVDQLDGKTIYNSHKVPDLASNLTHVTSVGVADRTWKLKINAPKDFGVGVSALPQAIFAGGQAFSLLLIIIFWLQARGRYQALNLAGDITRDLQKERNIAVTNDRKSSAILESIGDGVFAIDTKGRLTVLNHVAESIAGISADDAIGRPYDEVLKFEYETNGRVNNNFVKKALVGRVASMANHTVIVRRDGKKTPVADSAAPIRDAKGKIIGAIIVFRDVSKEYELDRAKTEFVSLASHQLRTPLSAINWYGEMLLGGDAGKLNKDQHEYIQEIFEGSQRMAELVNSLLDVSRLEVGKLTTQPVPTDLSIVIDSLEKELEVSIANKQLEVQKDIHPLPMVLADPKQLRMVLQNLMSNAVKYTSGKGRIKIILRLATLDDVKKAGLDSETQCWFFSIQDDGYGIPKEQQSKIFGKLFRADNVRKLDVEGTGLGLYIVKEVVKKMGGRVWFDSTENIGTTFFVIAPIDITHKK